MKKLLVMVTAAMAVMMASAEYERVAMAKFADTASIVKGVSKIGEFTGNQMIGVMVSSFITDNEAVKLFGPVREGACSSLIFYANNEDLDDVKVVAFYPVTLTKKALLDKGTCKEVDGVIKTVAEECNMPELCLQVSADEKWLVISDCPNMVKMGCKDLAFAEKPLKRELATMEFDEQFIAKVIQEIEKDDKSEEDKIAADEAIKILKGIGAMKLGLVVDDNGVEICGLVEAKAGSELTKLGTTPLTANSLDFAPASAIFANAAAKGAGTTYIDLNELVALLKKHGIDVSSFFTWTEKNNVVDMTIDWAKLFAFAKTFDPAKVCENDGCEKLVDEVGKLIKHGPTPEMKSSLKFKGYAKTVASPAARAKTVLPNIDAKKPFSLQFFSLYSLLNSALPQLMEIIPEADREGLKPILPALPPESKGGIVTALWREGNNFAGVVRISDDELKNLSVTTSIGAAYVMQKQMELARQRTAELSAECEADDDEDEADDVEIVK